MAIVLLVSCGRKDSAGEPPDPVLELPAVHIAVASHRSCAVMKDGSLRCWGLVPGRPTAVATPVQIAEVHDAERVILGGSDTAPTTCVLHRDKAVSCWGQPPGVPADTDAATGRVPSLTGATRLALGDTGGCAALGNGEVRCWGPDIALAPKGGGPIAGVSGAVDVQIGSRVACALVRDRRVMCWGDWRERAQGEMPTDYSAGAVVDDVDELAVMISRLCVRRRDKLICSAGKDWSDALEVTGDARQIAGTDPVCAVLGGGGVMCAGGNVHGELGTGAVGGADALRLGDVAGLRPVQGVSGARQVAAGSGHACALDDRGAVWCWGWNPQGELGDGSLRDRSTAVAVADLGGRVLPAPRDGVDDTSEAAGPAQVWPADLPAGCARDAELAVTGPGLRDGAMPIVSAYASITGAGAYLTLRLADHRYDIERANYGVRGRQRTLEILLEDVATPDDRAVAPGRYTPDDKAHKLTSTTVYAVGPAPYRGDGTGFPLAPESVVEVTHVDEQWACGTISLAGTDGSARGQFVAARD